jgi:hypothetical protein
MKYEGGCCNDAFLAAFHLFYAGFYLPKMQFIIMGDRLKRKRAIQARGAVMQKLGCAFL